MIQGRELIKRCASLTGLSAIFAESLVLRAIQSEGIQPDEFSTTHIPRILPLLARSMSLFLKPADATAGLDRLRSLATS